MSAKLDNFVLAFKMDSSSCKEWCNCGRVFYDTANEGWTWEENEFEELEADPEATGLPYAIERLEVEGTYYVPECHCWRDRAKQIIGFLDGHAHSVAEYFKLEKARKIAIADNAIEIKL